MQTTMDQESARETTVQLIEYIRTSSHIKVIAGTQTGRLNVTFIDGTIATLGVDELLDKPMSTLDVVSLPSHSMR